MGTRTTSNALKVAQPQAPKPKLEKSIHVSRIDTSVSLDIFTEYILENSQLKSPEDLKCSLLVKKDTDISKLSFISFKVDVNGENFAKLIDVNFWPQGSFIREFISQPKTATLGSFMRRPSIDVDAIQPNKLPKPSNEIPKNEDGTTLVAAVAPVATDTASLPNTPSDVIPLLDDSPPNEVMDFQLDS